MSDILIQKLIEYIEGSKDFFLEHAPDVLAQILEAKKLSATFGVFTFFGLLSACSLLSFLSYKFPAQDRYAFWNAIKWLGGWMSLIMLFAAVSNIYDLVLIKKCPKYVIIKELSNLKNDKK